MSTDETPPRKYKSLWEKRACTAGCLAAASAHHNKYTHTGVGALWQIILKERSSRACSAARKGTQQEAESSAALWNLHTQTRTAFALSLCCADEDERVTVCLCERLFFISSLTLLHLKMRDSSSMCVCLLNSCIAPLLSHIAGDQGAFLIKS
jgi:hypothetical protein